MLSEWREVDDNRADAVVNSPWEGSDFFAPPELSTQGCNYANITECTCLTADTAKVRAPKDPSYLLLERQW